MTRPVPVFIYPDSLKIIVFGGGQVALRKCRYFEGADMTVIAKTVLPEVAALARKVIKGQIPDDISVFTEGADLVIAATDDPDLNAKIRDSTKAAGLFANSSHGGGDLLIPSVLRRDKYSVAISSEGNAPAFNPYMVEELDALLDPKYDLMLDLLIELKKIGKEKLPTTAERKEFMIAVLKDPTVLELIAKGDPENAKKRALSIGGIS